MKYKGEIADFPPGVVKKMLEYQADQRNPENISVFEECKTDGVRGFVWSATPEGILFWDEVINKKKFRVFYNEYPFTIEDLREGWCALVNDDTHDVVKKVVKTAFPDDPAIIAGLNQYYFASSNSDIGPRWKPANTFDVVKAHVKKIGGMVRTVHASEMYKQIKQDQKIPDKWFVKIPKRDDKPELYRRMKEYYNSRDVRKGFSFSLILVSDKFEDGSGLFYGEGDYLILKGYKEITLQEFEKHILEPFEKSEENMEKVYTIDDLRNGKVVLVWEKDYDVEKFMNYMSYAFPDELPPLGNGDLYYARPECPDKYWLAYMDDKDQLEGIKNLPKQSFSIFYKQFKSDKSMSFKKEFPLKLDPNDAKRIIDIACDSWRQDLAGLWSKHIVLNKTINVDKRHYESMRKACTQEQHELFDEIFGPDKGEELESWEDCFEKVCVGKQCRYIGDTSTVHAIVPSKVGSQHYNLIPATENVEKIIALSKLMVVAAALNDGWEYKGSCPCYMVRNDSVGVLTVFRSSHDATPIRFKTRELAEKAIKIAEDDFKVYLK